MADSDDESSVASEDWHHEFDDYHSQAAADIYTMIYKSWPKRPDWRGHSWKRHKKSLMEVSVQCILEELPGQTTSQLDFLDGLVDKINAHRAYLRQQLSPRPRRRGSSAWGRVGPVTDPLRRILREYCFADARASARATCRAWRETAPSSYVSLLLAVAPLSGEPGGILVRALDELEDVSQKQLSHLVLVAQPIASQYAKTTGDIRIAAAAFRLLRLCPLAPGVADAAVRLVSEEWRWSDPADNRLLDWDVLFGERDVQRCVAFSAGMILRETPTLVMQHFAELAVALENYEYRNKSVGASVESIFVHTMPTARVAAATAATWMPRASDTDLPGMARMFAWRVLRWMPLAEQLLALPAIVADVGNDQAAKTEAVEIFLAVGGAVEPYASQIVPAMHAALESDLTGRERYVKLLGRLGAWQGPEALDISSLIDLADEKVEASLETRNVAERILEDVARGTSAHKAMYLLNELLGNRIPHRIVSNCNTLIELACSHLEPELVSACVTAAVGWALGNGYADRANWISRRNLDVIKALVHGEESGLPSAIKQAFTDGLDSLSESFAAVSLRWGLATEPTLLIYNSLLSHLSLDHVRRATELVLNAYRENPRTTDDPFAPADVLEFEARAAYGGRRPGMVFRRGDRGQGYYQDSPRHEASDALMTDILAAWVEGRRYGMSPLPNSAARGDVSAVVICACMEDLRDRGPTPLLGTVFNAYASSAVFYDARSGLAATGVAGRTVADPIGFANSLLPFVREPLPARLVTPPLSALRTINASVPNAAAKITEQRARDEPLARRSNEARRKFRMDIIRAYGRCCAASDVAELASLLDDQSRYPIPDGTLVSIGSVAAVALLECVILRPGAGANLDASARARFLRALRGRRLVPLAVLSAEKYWYARSEDDVCFDVALLFAQDPNRSVRDEGYAIFKRSQRSYLSRRTLEAVGLLATSLREEVREIACRMIKQCFKNSSKYFASCEEARDLAYKRIEPLLGDGTLPPTYPTETLYEYFDDLYPSLVYTERDMFADAIAVRIAAVEAACFASGWQPTCFASRDRRDRCLRAVVDVMRYDPVEAVRDAAADGLRYTHGGLWLRYINPRQPMMDAFVVKKRKKRRRRSNRRSKSL